MKKFLKLKLPRLTHSGHFHTNSGTADHPGSGLSRNSRNLWGPLIADCISSTAPRPPSNSPTPSLRIIVNEFYTYGSASNWAPLDSVEKILFAVQVLHKNVAIPFGRLVIIDL